MIDTDTISVIHETDAFLFLYKPTGIHSAVGLHEQSVVAWLQENYPAYALYGRRPEDAGLLQRLDFETTGIMTVAKNAHAREQFIAASLDGKIQKRYFFIALPGQDESWVCTDPIGQQARGSKKVKTASQSKHLRGLQPATTSFELVKATACALYRATITEGRRHQVRVHAAVSGVPLINDLLYGGASNDVVATSFFLCGYELSCEALGLHVTSMPSACSPFQRMLDHYDLGQAAP
jgi:23S rRNA pseudouridine1911/1915/1917 synthase